MGPSYSVQSAAQALVRHHPNYYFLVDRDHHSDEFVNQCWRNFPDIDTYNLLVWRRREIENYFLDPGILVTSSHCHWSVDELEKALVRFATNRLFLDVVNYVVSSVREEQKTTWVQHFSNPDEFPSKAEAIDRLMSMHEFPDRRRAVSTMVTKQELRRRFQSTLAVLTGGGEELVYGRGRWVEMIKGKAVLGRLLNAGGFRVRDAQGGNVTGKEMTRVILSELAKDVDRRPDDISELGRLIENRVQGQG